MRRSVLLLVTAAAVLAPALPSSAAVCPAGYTGAQQVLDTGARAAGGPQYGAPDTRWVAVASAGVPVVETTTPAWSVRPAPGWLTPAGNVTWISSSGAGSGTVAPTPAGTTTTYRTVFAAPDPLTGYAFVSLSFAGDDEIRWYLNGRLMAWYLPPPTDPTSPWDEWHPLTITVHIRGGHNILEAGVTNRGGNEGLVVRGAAIACVRTIR